MDAPKINNIDYLFSGYDPYLGNPMPTGETPDPGFRQAIFNTEYKGSTTPDSLFCTPEGFTFQLCDDSCQIDFKSTVIPGTNKYSEGLNAIVSGMIGKG